MPESSFLDQKSSELLIVFLVFGSSRGGVKLKCPSYFFRCLFHHPRHMSRLKDAMSSGSVTGTKAVFPAAERNKEHILQVLKSVLRNDEVSAHSSPLLVEIASGSGQHIAHFAPNFPDITFQPTEVSEDLLGSLASYAQDCPTKNILHPILLDVRDSFSQYSFEKHSIDYIYNANMMHISPWECTVGLFDNAGMYLKIEGLMITYGPYAVNGKISPESNVAFDNSLRSKNPLWGVRDIVNLQELAEVRGLTLIDTIEMPSNNKTLIWKKLK